MTRECCSEVWTVDKIRMVNQIGPKHRKWTPEITGTIDKYRCMIEPAVIGSYVIWSTYSPDWVAR